MDPWLTAAIMIAGLVLIIIAFIGSVLPGLPGTPLGLVSFFLFPITGLFHYKGWWLTLLVLLIIMVVIVSILDYVFPVIMTKYFGGTKYAQWGGTLGILAGIFITSPLGPLAIIVGPFVGAFAGEILAGKSLEHSLKAASGSLLGFLAGTFGKICVCTVELIFYLAICTRVISHLI